MAYRTSKTEIVVSSVVGLTFILAGVLKAWYAVEFAGALRSILRVWNLGFEARLALGIALATCEVGLGVALVLRIAPRISAWAAVGLLLAFSIVLIVLLRRPEPPSCACFAIPLRAGARAELVAGLVRNGALLWMTLWLLARRATRAGVSATRARGGHRAGFTLVELLAVIAIVTVIIALVLPSLRGARRAARDSAQLAVLRDLHHASTAYADEHGGVLPYLQTPGAPQVRRTIDEYEFSFGYFTAQKWLWSNLIWPAYLDAKRSSIERPEVREYNVEVRGYPPGVVVSDYVLTYNAAARPAYWRLRRAGEPDLLSFLNLRPALLHEVRFPADKGLVIRGEGFSFADERGLAFYATADGGAVSHPYRDFDPANVVDRPWGADAIAVLSTRDGFEGRDR